MSDKPSPCPVCGEDEGLDVSQHPDNPQCNHVKCMECGTSGFLEPLPFGCEYHWNNRANNKQALRDIQRLRLLLAESAAIINACGAMPFLRREIDEALTATAHYGEID